MNRTSTEPLIISWQKVQLFQGCELKTDNNVFHIVICFYTDSKPYTTQCLKCSRANNIDIFHHIISVSVADLSCKQKLLSATSLFTSGRHSRFLHPSWCKPPGDLCFLSGLNPGIFYVIDKCISHYTTEPPSGMFLSSSMMSLTIVMQIMASCKVSKVTERKIKVKILKIPDLF